MIKGKRLSVEQESERREGGRMIDKQHLCLLVCSLLPPIASASSALMDVCQCVRGIYKNRWRVRALNAVVFALFPLVLSAAVRQQKQHTKIHRQRERHTHRGASFCASL